MWAVGGVFNFFSDSTDPNVKADWFITGVGPYGTTVTIGASLLLLLLLAGIIGGTLAGDAGGMLRSIALELPVSILGIIGLVTITQVLIQLTDALSGQVLGSRGRSECWCSPWSQSSPHSGAPAHDSRSAPPIDGHGRRRAPSSAARSGSARRPTATTAADAVTTPHPAAAPSSAGRSGVAASSKYIGPTTRR